jgi:hypothetical protein
MISTQLPAFCCCAAVLLQLAVGPLVPTTPIAWMRVPSGAMQALVAAALATGLRGLMIALMPSARTPKCGSTLGMMPLWA